MKVISIVLQKGGVGKTATAVNLAYNLTLKGQKVCLIDFDPQASATLHCGVKLKNESNTVYNFLKFPDNSIATQFDDVAVKVHGFHLLPSNRMLSTANSNDAAGLKILKNTIENSDMMGRFDYVIIDSSPSAGFLNNNAICCADYMIIVSNCKYLGVAAIDKTIHTFTTIKDTIKGVNAEIMGILPTFYNKSKREDIRSLNSINCNYSIPVFRQIRDNTTLSECPEAGLPVNLHNPKCNGAVDYMWFTDEFLERINK